jgi:hypothetical protein
VVERAVTESRAEHCPSCGAVLHGRFCSECGLASDRPRAAAKVIPWPYVIGGALIALLGAALMIQRDGGSSTAAAPVAIDPPVTVGAPTGSEVFNPTLEGTPPDLSTMAPRERFDRLFDRVMRASEGGDTVTVTAFSPMALAAYGMLDAPDIDARFHAGLIRLATGDPAGATALADAIASEQPAHLFGSLLKASAAELAKDPAALGAAERAFQAAYPAETTAQRPEYGGHKAILDRFFQESSARATTARP